MILSVNFHLVISALQGHRSHSGVPGGGCADHPSGVWGKDPRADQEIRQGTGSVV